MFQWSKKYEWGRRPNSHLISSNKGKHERLGPKRGQNIPRPLPTPKPMSLITSRVWNWEGIMVSHNLANPRSKCKSTPRPKISISRPPTPTSITENEGTRKIPTYSPENASRLTLRKTGPQINRSAPYTTPTPRRTNRIGNMVISRNLTTTQAGKITKRKRCCSYQGSNSNGGRNPSTRLPRLTPSTPWKIPTSRPGQYHEGESYQLLATFETRKGKRCFWMARMDLNQTKSRRPRQKQNFKLNT